MSTILPLPSSPHCAPRTAMFVFGIRVYRNPRCRSITTHRGTEAPSFPFPGPQCLGAPVCRDQRLPPMIYLDGSSLTLDELVAIANDFTTVSLTDTARARVRAARAVVDEFADRETPTYGINTGFGSFAEVKIPHESLSQLQVNLLRSHAAGVGDPLPVPVVRATIALRANVLAKGFSGIRLETLELLVELLNRRVHPVVPSRGSVGASGDLAPLAHLALVLIGEGVAWNGHDREPGGKALQNAGLTPTRLAAKEGLALINGTQASTALLGLSTGVGERLARTADVVAALSIDALRGSTRPFDPR